MAISNIRSGINFSKAAQLLESIAEQHSFDNPNSVFANDNVIKAFGQYLIKKSNSGCIIYKRNVPVLETSSVRCALSWCVADKYKIASLKNKLIEYDTELTRRQNDVLYYTHTIKNSQDIALKNTLFDRLLQCQDKIKATKNKLDKCINSTKYWQQKGFDNETS